jgi:dihydrofolate synthase/folylpolyglutamate synthase
MSMNRLCEKLYARRRFGMRPGLERMEALLANLGHPERELLAIHVAGTNGKGSVVALAAGILQAAGLGRVGRYTSPHLLLLNERICIDGQPVSDALLRPVLEEVEAAAAALDARSEAGELTFFECITAAAFTLFRHQGIRLAVIETGLGGRLDATNVLLPVLSVITRIGLEHCEYLGHTLAAVAGEKAGIIKTGRPVVVGAMDGEALDKIAAVARSLGSVLIQANDAVTVAVRQQGFDGLAATVATEQRELGRIRLALAGSFQAENLATAIAAVETFAQVTGLEIPDAAFKEGLAGVRWPGRFQVVKREPVVIVDGAHNPDAARSLKEALHRSRFKGPVALVAGFCDDKDVAGVLKLLAGSVRLGWAVDIPSGRSLPAAETAAAMKRAGIEARIAPSLEAAAGEAEAWAAAAQGLVVICGSLFLAGEALRHYDAFPWSVSCEADPNEQLKA